MAFKIFKWFTRKDDDASERTGTEVSVGDFLDIETQAAMAGIEIYLMRLAFWTIVRKIGAAVAAVEWQTMQRGEEVRGEEYWSWNYDPNPNESRQQFFMKMVAQLYLRQEALIVETRQGYRYVADAFTKTTKISGHIYQDIVVDGESIPGVFRAQDVLHITIEGERIKRILNAVAGAEGELMSSAAKNYLRSQGTRGILNIDDLAEADPEFEEIYSDLVNEKFKKYFTAQNAVLPLFKGYTFDPEKGESGTSKSQSVGTRDIRNMMDDVIDLTAQAFGVPDCIVTGKNITDAAYREFLTYPVKDIVRKFQGEVNRKIYGRKQVFKGTYIAPNMRDVRYTDIFDVANPIDKLIGSGAFCINDIRQRLGLDIIDEPWAWQHWMTKNYSTVGDLLTGVEGEEDGETDKQ